VAELSRTACLPTGDSCVQLVRMMINLLFAFLPMTNQYLLSLSSLSLSFLLHQHQSGKVLGEDQSNRQECVGVRGRAGHRPTNYNLLPNIISDPGGAETYLSWS